MYKEIIGFLPILTLRKNIITIRASMEVSDADAAKFESGEGLKRRVETFLSQRVAEETRNYMRLGKDRLENKMATRYYAKVRIVK